MGEELVVRRVTNPEASRMGVKPGAKIMKINGAEVSNLGSESLVNVLKKLPPGVGAEIEYAERCGEWWLKAKKIKVKMAPPFGIDLPYVEKEQLSITRTKPEAMKVGLRTGQKILHVTQNDKEIWAVDLNGESLVNSLVALERGVVAELTVAEFGGA